MANFIPDLTPGQAGFVSGASGIFGSLANIGSTILTNRANMDLAKYSFDMQRQMIAEQNRYNSPLEQMKRYEEAGLNPALIYGNGMSSAGNQQSIAKYEAPTLQAPDIRTSITDAMRMALAYRQQEADIKLKEEQAYAQKMLGLGYEQDAYMKQVDSAVKALNAGLKTPPGVWSNEELEQLRTGNAVKKYDLETKGQEALNAYREALTLMSQMSRQEQEFINNFILPLNEKLLSLQVEGQSYENLIKEADAETERLVRLVGATSNTWKAGAALAISMLGDTEFGRFLSRKMKKLLKKGSRSGTR